MNENDKKLWQLLKDNPKKYMVVVDNDCVTIQEKNPYNPDTQKDLYNNFDAWYENFSNFGQYFIVDLFRELGYTAEFC